MINLAKNLDFKDFTKCFTFLLVNLINFFIKPIDISRFGDLKFFTLPLNFIYYHHLMTNNNPFLKGFHLLLFLYNHCQKVLNISHSYHIFYSDQDRIDYIHYTLCILCHITHIFSFYSSSFLLNFPTEAKMLLSDSSANLSIWDLSLMP